MRPAKIGALGPLDAEPAQVFERRGGEFLTAARQIEVFDPHHEAGAGRPARGQGKRPRMAHVQEAGRRRGESSAFHASQFHTSHQLPVAST